MVVFLRLSPDYFTFNVNTLAIPFQLFRLMWFGLEPQIKF